MSKKNMSYCQTRIIEKRQIVLFVDNPLYIAYNY